ncbi:MAG: MraZ protein [Bacteroidia bacterium]|jgi:MraZ protein
MATYIGEFGCRVDDKGRLLLPAGLKKQIPSEFLDLMVINRGMDQCLTLYTKQDWLEESKRINNLNDFNKTHRKLKRWFHNGASELKIDTASRINIPKKLCEYAEIEQDVIVNAYDNKIEIWSKHLFEESMDFDSDAFSNLAEEVLGNDVQPNGDE